MGTVARRAQTPVDVVEMLKEAREIQLQLSSGNMSPKENDELREQLWKQVKICSVADFVGMIQFKFLGWRSEQFYAAMERTGVMVKLQGNWLLAPEYKDIPLYVLAWHSYALTEEKRAEKAAESFSGTAPKCGFRLQGYLTRLGMRMFQILLTTQRVYPEGKTWKPVTMKQILVEQGLLESEDGPRQMELNLSGVQQAPESKLPKAMEKYRKMLRELRGNELLARMNTAKVFLAATPSGYPIRFCYEDKQLWFCAADIMMACGRTGAHYGDIFKDVRERRMPSLYRNASEDYIMVPMQQVWVRPEKIRSKATKKAWVDEVLPALLPLMQLFERMARMCGIAEEIVKEFAGEET